MDEIKKSSVALNKILQHIEDIEFENPEAKKLLKKSIRNISRSIDSLDELYWELANSIGTDFDD